MKIQILAVTALLVVASVPKSHADQQSRIYCGRHLAETMAQICDYGAEKRASRNDIEYLEKLGWFGPRTYHAFSGVKGKRDGIIESCCARPCDIDTLLMYC